MKQGGLFSNTLLLGAASAITKTLSFFLLPLYTSVLSPAEFGMADILVSTAVLLLPLASLYAPEAVFRFYTAGERGAIRCGLLLLGIGNCTFALLLPLLGFSVLLRPYLGLLYLYVFCSILRSFMAHVVRADGEFLLYTLQQLFCALLTMGLQFFFLYVRRLGVWGYLLAVIVADGITFLLLLFLHYGQVKKNGAVTRVLFYRMLRYSVPLIPTALLWWVLSISDRYFILHFHGEAVTGLYAAAGRLPSLLSFAVGVFLEAWHYAALRQREGEEGSLFGRIYKLLLPSLFLLAGGLILVSGPLVRLLLSSEYESAAALLPLLLFAALCGGLASFLDSIYTLKLSTRSSLYTSFVAAVCNLALNFLLIPRHAALGAALSTAISYALLLLVRLWHTRRFLFFSRQSAYLLPALALMLTAAILYALGHRITASLILLFSLLVLWRLILRAALFFGKRGVILLKDLKKRKEYRKKI